MLIIIKFNQYLQYQDSMKTEVYTELYKIIVIGDAGVGKTSIVKKVTSGKQVEDTKPTVGVDFLTHSFRIANGTKVKAQIWDTAGSEKYKAVTTVHYRKAQGALVVFDLTSRKSFESAPNWIRKAKELCDPQVVIMLVGNKCDLPNRAVSSADIETLCHRENLMYDETSTRQGKLNRPFELLLEQINRKNEEREPEKSNIVGLGNTAQLNSGCSC